MYEIYISGQIGWDATAENLRESIADADGADLLIKINSAGGSYTDGPAMYSYLRQHKGRVITQVDGIAYSMAAILLQAGHTRRMAENAVIMVHGAQVTESGSAETLRDTADAADSHNKVLANILKERDIPQTKIDEWIFSGKDFFFSADEALEAGLVDEVSQSVDLAACSRSWGKALDDPFSAQKILQIAAMGGASMSTENQHQQQKDQESQNQGNENQQEFHASTGFDIGNLMNQNSAVSRKDFSNGAQAEFKRQKEIRELFSEPGFDTEKHRYLMDAFLEDQTISIDAARAHLLKAISSGFFNGISQNAPDASYQGFPGKPDTPMRPATAGADSIDKFIDGTTKALYINASVDKFDPTTLSKEDLDLRRKEQRNNEFLSMSMFELARYYLTSTGRAPKAMSREGVIAEALTVPAIRQSEGFSALHTGSDFSHLLSNVANKALLKGWVEADETWREWCSTGNLQDFKEADLINVSLFDNLKPIGPNGEYQHGTMEDIIEKTRLRTYGALFAISRYALVNDDLNGLGNTPFKMGRAAARMVGDIAYDILLTNPVMNQDGVTLFHASHNNIGTPGPISALPGGTLDELSYLIRAQVDPQKVKLNIRSRRLVVPAKKEISTLSTVEDATMRDIEAAQEMRNVMRGRFTVTSDIRLDAVSTDAWYMLADQNQYDTVQVSFLRGQEEPFMDSKEGWTRDGIEYKVRIDASAKALDFRSIAKNDGV